MTDPMMSVSQEDQTRCARPAKNVIRDFNGEMPYLTPIMGDLIVYSVDGKRITPQEAKTLLDEGADVQYETYEIPIES